MNNKGTVLIKIISIIALALLLCYSNTIQSSSEDLQIPDIVQLSSMYTYSEMQMDISELQAWYSDIINTISIGTTVLGNNIYCIILGNPDAPHNIMIQSTVHAREYPASQVVMKTIEYYCQYSKTNPLFLENVCFYIVPMANPDGVEITQFGTAHLTDPATISFVQSQGHINEWKANARGVDINRNFDVGWNQLKTKHSSPSYMRYKGPSAASEIETIALVNLATIKDYDCYISYHMQGNLIYYDEPGNAPQVSAASTDLAQIISSINSYKMVNLKHSMDGDNVQQGGFTDWVQLTLNKPACTVELGTSLPPKAQSSVPSIYEKNKNTWFAVAVNYLQ